MICYKDKTFCNSDCINTNCDRHLSFEEELRASRFGLPIASCDFSPRCDDYIMITDVDIDDGDLEGIIEDN